MGPFFSLQREYANSMHSMIGGSGGMLPQKILKNRCSEGHFLPLSSGIEQRKFVKKLIF